MNCLTEQDVQSYRTEGYHCPAFAIAEDEAADIRRKLEAHEEAHGAIKQVKPHLLFTWLDRLVRGEQLLDVVEDLIGPNIFCWGSSFFVKDAHSPHYVTWHQDANYIGLEPNEMVTAWIALTPSNASNGAMRVIPGTHRQSFPHHDTFAAENLLSRGQEIAVEVDGRNAVMMVLRPGEFSLHNTLLVHGSDPNPSDDRRIGFVARFVPTHVRQTQASADTALLVRGVDDHHHFEHEISPDGDYTPGVRAYHAQLAQRRKGVVLQEEIAGAERPGRWS